jgi:hypothetical protein
MNDNKYQIESLQVEPIFLAGKSSHIYSFPTCVDQVRYTGISSDRFSLVCGKFCVQTSKCASEKVEAF